MIASSLLRPEYKEAKTRYRLNENTITKERKYDGDGANIRWRGREHIMARELTYDGTGANIRWHGSEHMMTRERSCDNANERRLDEEPKFRR